MHGVAGKKHPVLAVAVGEQQILPPRRARQHLIFHRNADDSLECRLHLFIAVDDGVQGPMFGRILHDQERRFGVGHVIVPAVAGPRMRTVTDRHAIEQFVAAEERLTQPQQIAFAGQPDAKLPAHRAGAAVAADEVGGADILRAAVVRLHPRGDAVFVLAQRQEFAAIAHGHRGKRFGHRLEKRLERVLRDQLIGFERQRAVIAGARLRPRLVDRRIGQVQQRRLGQFEDDVDVHRAIGPQAGGANFVAPGPCGGRFPSSAH